MEEDLFLLNGERRGTIDIFQIRCIEGALEGGAFIGNDMCAAGVAGIDKVEAQAIRIIDERRDGELGIRKAGFFAYSAKEGAKISNVTVDGTLYYDYGSNVTSSVYEWIAEGSAATENCDYAGVKTKEKKIGNN